MEKKDYAKECGLRLRRVRMAKNMSQHYLADKMFTSPQNVSKWENQGISDIDTIKELSRILGQDILSNERDKEGVVGEIGKHILKQIAKNNGFIAVWRLDMYGLNTEIVTDEIFKLERIGMCVREQYKNFYNDEKDMLFITAKGLIALNNFSMFGNVESKTYEQFLENRDTIQDYYDKNQLEKLVRNLQCYGTYRIDYINYLVNKYERNYIDEGSDHCSYHGTLNLFENILPRWDAENNILFRMITGLNDEFMSGYLECYLDSQYDFWENEDSEEFEDFMEYLRLDSKYSDKLDYFDSQLCDVSETINKWCDNVWVRRQTLKKERTESEISEEEKYYLKQKTLEKEEFDEWTAFQNGDIEYFIKRRNAFVDGKYPSEWFSFDEIKTFIKENFRSAETPKEKEIDEILAKINELDPSSLDYYKCSWKWREAGIENLIKSFYSLPIEICENEQGGDA